MKIFTIASMTICLYRLSCFKLIMQQICFFLAVHFVASELYDDHIEDSTSNTTSRTIGVDVSTWYYRSDDIGIISDIYCMDNQSTTATGAGNIYV